MKLKDKISWLMGTVQQSLFPQIHRHEGRRASPVGVTEQFSAISRRRGRHGSHCLLFASKWVEKPVFWAHLTLRAPLLACFESA